MTGPRIEFDTAFEALTAHSPLRWQCRLFELLRSGQGLPRVCDLPTGLGKTSVIPIWMIALAWQVQDGSVSLPRRLVYIINRRTVVDQATDVVQGIRERLVAPSDPRWSRHAAVLRSLGEALKRLGSTEQSPLAVSTLRGELADNEEWKVDPSRPAIIVGTIDMIGSKLLFSGYGDGRYGRAQHAGLVGQDSLIVHDEAHLTPAFSDVLQHVAQAQRRAREERHVRVMELSATSRGGDGNVLQLQPEDELDGIVRDRLNAPKRLHLHEVEEAGVIEKLVALSKAHDEERAKVLVYVRSPEDALKVTHELGKQSGVQADTRVAVLTGTIRGHERDQLVRANHVYRALLDPESQVERTVYLVSTSAGEVGVDLDADHMVCDLTTLDSMIQRLGRVNRRGGQGRVARVDIVVHGEAKAKEKPSELERAMQASWGILNLWSAASGGVVDASPGGLRALLGGLDDEQRRRAFSPKPVVPPLTDILLDAWSLTSIMKQMPGRPEVAPYLHGLTNDPPETYIVWRKEVPLLYEAGADAETLCDWFLACRIEARERLRDRTDHVRRTLETLLNSHRKKAEERDFPVVLLNERSEAEWWRLSEIVKKEFSLAYRTIVLPVDAGGLNPNGMLDAEVTESTTDVADQAGVRERRLLTLRDGEAGAEETLVPKQAAQFLAGSLNLVEQHRLALGLPAEGAEEEGESRYLLLMAQPKWWALENPETAKTKQTLDDHTRQIVQHANRIADALELSPALKEALVMAAERHDRGKNRPVWQRFACSPDSDTPLAKSTKYLHGRALGGYRHEFGSLVEAAPEEKVRQHAEADLILHLVAAHHGWARPHFEPKAWDHTRTTPENEQAAAEVMRRFGRLQQRYGRWGLAWVEALLRCADIAASK